MRYIQFILLGMLFFASSLSHAEQADDNSSVVTNQNLDVKFSKPKSSCSSSADCAECVEACVKGTCKNSGWTLCSSGACEADSKNCNCNPSCIPCLEECKEDGTCSPVSKEICRNGSCVDEGVNCPEDCSSRVNGVTVEGCTNCGRICRNGRCACSVCGQGGFACSHSAYQEFEECEDGTCRRTKGGDSEQCPEACEPPCDACTGSCLKSSVGLVPDVCITSNFVYCPDSRCVKRSDAPSECLVVVVPR